jgi:hypothetical protein
MAATSIPAHRFETAWPREQAPRRAAEPILLDQEPSVAPARWRQAAVNVVGWTCVAGAVAVSGWMVTSTRAANVIAFWGTMGWRGDLVPPREEVAPEVVAAPGAEALLTQLASRPVAAAEPSAPATAASVAPVAAPKLPVAPVTARKPPVSAPKLHAGVPARPNAWQKREEASEDPHAGATPLPEAPVADDPYESY